MNRFYISENKQHSLVVLIITCITFCQASLSLFDGLLSEWPAGQSATDTGSGKEALVIGYTEGLAWQDAISARNDIGTLSYWLEAHDS